MHSICSKADRLVTRPKDIAQSQSSQQSPQVTPIINPRHKANPQVEEGYHDDLPQLGAAKGAERVAMQEEKSPQCAKESEDGAGSSHGVGGTESQAEKRTADGAQKIDDQGTCVTEELFHRRADRVERVHIDEQMVAAAMHKDGRDQPPELSTADREIGFREKSNHEIVAQDSLTGHLSCVEQNRDGKKGEGGRRSSQAGDWSRPAARLSFVFHIYELT